MKKQWCVDRHVIEAKFHLGALLIRINDIHVASIAPKVLAHFSIPWFGRSVEIRRVRNLDVVSTELWVTGRLCGFNTRPPTPWLGDATSCEVHNKPFVLTCATCQTQGLCEGCLELDGCRCSACFEESAQLFRTHTQRVRRWSMIGCTLAGVLPFLAGHFAGAEIVVQMGIGVVVLTLITAFTGPKKERAEEGILPTVALTVVPDVLTHREDIMRADRAVKKVDASGRGPDWETIFALARR